MSETTHATLLERVRDLEARLDALVQKLERQVEPLAAPALDEETEAHLRALGYL